MPVKNNRALAFDYTVERYPEEGNSSHPKKNKYHDVYRTMHGEYALAMDSLLDHIDRMWNGYELTINKIIVYKLV